MLLTVPQAGRPGRFAVTLVQLRAGVARQLHLPVVGAGPHDPFLLRRLRDGEDDAGVFDADVIGREAAGTLLPRLVAGGQVGTDHLASFDRR